ncbi:MAG: fucose isomerase [Phycisphaerae bacterium]
MPQDIYLIANGDLRESANRKCEEAQLAMEAKLTEAIRSQFGRHVKRAHGRRDAVGHSFIDSQKYGMEVFKSIPAEAPLIVAEAVWQYSHHVLHGLLSHRGPILTVANWSGTWPGLVGMLNLNGSLTKAGVHYSSLWSEDFTDDYFLSRLKQWIETGHCGHDTSHAKLLDTLDIPADAREAGESFARELKANKAIMGVFDEGCMGMFNAIIPDHLLMPTGVFKERLSQSALYYAMTQVTDAEARDVFDWYKQKGVKFHFGKNEAADLTEAQVLAQCKMYVAALRIADDFGCGTIGIQYQQGLKDLAPASDLVEGTLNNTDRPPAKSTDGRELYAGEALPHFNEVDECAGLDGYVTYHLWKKLGYPPENTLHDLRWGRAYSGPGRDGEGNETTIDGYVWVFLISGGAPPAHFEGGWAGTHSYRQPPMYFRLGGGTCAGVSHPGHLVWSRVFIEDGRLKFDTGTGKVVALPEAETQDRLDQTTPVWPIMHATLDGVTRDQMMARHKSNHIQCVYAPTAADAKKAMYAKAAAMRELGLEVAVCGEV